MHTRAHATYLRALLSGVCWIVASPASSQPVYVVPPIQQQVGAVTCPGDPPGNLASLDCLYTKTMRAEELVAGHVTDQAILGAGFFGLVALVRNSPPEWGRGWEGFGRQAGVRYAQSAAKGLATFGVGAILQTDPRHVSYASDPLIPNDQRTGGGWVRVGHAVTDWAGVRKTDRYGKGARMPNWPLFAGATVSGLVGNKWWYPERERTASATASRMASSFYNEFGPEIGRALGRLVRRGAAPSRDHAQPGVVTPP
jgi:hypothetical protein